MPSLLKISLPFLFCLKKSCKQTGRAPKRKEIHDLFKAKIKKCPSRRVEGGGYYYFIGVFPDGSAGIFEPVDDVGGLKFTLFLPSQKHFRIPQLDTLVEKLAGTEF